MQSICEVCMHREVATGEFYACDLQRIELLPKLI